MFTSSDKGEALSHSVIVVITWRQVNLHCVTSLRKLRYKSFYCSLRSAKTHILSSIMACYSPAVMTCIKRLN